MVLTEDLCFREPSWFCTLSFRGNELFFLEFYLDFSMSTSVLIKLPL